MLQLWQRAARNVWLSPEERAILKFVKSTIVSALISAIVAVYPFIAGAKNASVDWSNTWHTFLLTFLMVSYYAVDKYVTAHFPPATMTNSDGASTPQAEMLPLVTSPASDVNGPVQASTSTPVSAPATTNASTPTV